ncbi:acyloxyacyl hydrolase [Comamonas serinivorans]|nr:acyloxyacyl hydrolase [Comamonas serinivorans]
MKHLLPTPPHSSTRLVQALAALAVAGASLMPTMAHALDLSFVYAKGNRHSIEKYGVIAGWQHPNLLWQGQAWQVQLRHEVELATWRTDTVPDLYEFGYSPVFRLQRNTGNVPSGFYVEGAIGVRLLSHTRIHTDTTMSTAFQFSDMIGTGYQWGDNGRHTVGLRYVHLSNASIKKPNPGINYTTLFYRYTF